jgi:hypothetical protein
MPGKYLHQSTGAVLVMMGPTSNAIGDCTAGATAFNMADATHAGYLAEMECGGPLKSAPVPAWIQQTVIHSSADPPLCPAIRYPYQQPEVHMSNIGIPVPAEQFIGEATSANSSGSPAPDYTKHWMKT